MFGCGCAVCHDQKNQTNARDVMKGSTSLRFCLSAVVMCVTGGALTQATTPASMAQMTQRNVIVILRDQMPNLPPLRRAMGARAAALASAQASVMSALPHTAARPVRGFATINAFATTVSASEAAQLAAHPMVQAVVADAVIRAPIRNTRSSDGSGSGSGATNGGLCNTLEPEALQLTNAAF